MANLRYNSKHRFMLAIIHYQASLIPERHYSSAVATQVRLRQLGRFPVDCYCGLKCGMLLEFSGLSHVQYINNIIRFERTELSAVLRW